MNDYSGSGGRRPGNDRGGGAGSGATALFDPALPESELYDTLAEKQALSLQQINSSQLRKFFGEAKDLYRQYNALTAAVAEDEERERLYRERIEARFRMLRSKVAYAERPGGQSRLDRDFATFLKDGIQKVKTARDFVRFILHFEAVVGFMYGNGGVK